MAFHEVQFPTSIAYGSRGGVRFNTKVIRLDSGAEERVQRWGGAGLHTYAANWGVKTRDDLLDLIEFFIARQGATHGFRFHDHQDFTTAANGRDDPTALDVVIGTGDGSETQFQLVKTYTSGGISRTRNLRKPVSGTVLVALDGTPTASGWSVDSTTGIVTFTVAPSTDVVISAGCEFDVPCRFGEDVDQGGLLAQLDGFDSGSIPDIPIDELADETETAEEFFLGGSTTVSPMSADQTVSLLAGRVWVVDPSTSGLALILPATTGLASGGPYFYLVNDSSSYAVAVKDSGGSTLTTLAADGRAIVLLAGSTWYFLS